MSTSCAISHRALLSAHRGAAGQLGLRDNTWESLEAAVALAVDYVEFDVHRTADGVFVLHHLAHVRIGRRRVPVRTLTASQLAGALDHALVTYEQALRLLRTHRKKAHIDFKFTSPMARYAEGTTYEVEAARLALAQMREPADFILTSLVDRSIRVLRDWADRESPGTLVGLSLGLGVWRMNPLRQIALRISEVYPARRLRRSGASLVVVQHRLADIRVLRWAGRHGLPVLVWTVDKPRKLRRFLSDHRVWMVTSNHPGRAQAAEAYDVAA